MINIILILVSPERPQQPLSYLCNHKPIISKAIKEIRSKKKHPDIHSTYDYVMNSTASNIDKKSIQTIIDNLIQKDEIFNRKRTQGFNLLQFALYKVQQ